MPPSILKVSTSKDKFTSKEKLPTSKEKLPTSKEKLSTSKEKLPTSKEKFSLKDYNDSDDQDFNETETPVDHVEVQSIVIDLEASNTLVKIIKVIILTTS